MEKSYGHKLESVRDSEGHADTATALAVCLPSAMAVLKRGGSIAKQWNPLDPQNTNWREGANSWAERFEQAKARAGGSPVAVPDEEGAVRILDLTKPILR